MSAQDTIAMMAAQLMAGILIKDININSIDVERDLYTKYCVEKAMALYKETSKVFQGYCRDNFTMMAKDGHRMKEQEND